MASENHRRHRNRAEADQLAAEYEVSGLSQAEFCIERDVKLKTLARYVTRFRKRASSGTEPGKPQQLIPVELAGHKTQSEVLTVLLSGGIRIEVKRGFDPGTLRQLIGTLERV